MCFTNSRVLRGGKTPVNNSHRFKGTGCLETLAFIYQSAWRTIPEDLNL